MQLRWVTLLSFFPALCGYADTYSEMALCDPHETVLFSCATSRAGTDPQHPRSTPRRIVSFCATPMTTAVSGRLTYRFGADKQHVELRTPQMDALRAKPSPPSFTPGPKVADGR